MKSSIEKKKAFVNIFRGSLSEMSFFVKNNVFYKCSKANRYMMSVEVELMGAGTLNRINIGFASNYAPISSDRTTIHGIRDFDALRYLVRSNVKIREESGRFAGRNDVKGFVDHVEYIMPHVMASFAPLMCGFSSLFDYLAVEEALIEKYYEDFKGVSGGAAEETLLGYLSLGDFESAIRITNKLVEFHENCIARYRWQAKEDPHYVYTNDSIEETYKTDFQRVAVKGIEAVDALKQRIKSSFASAQQSLVENIQRATKDIESAIALREKIETGAVEDLIAEIALRDAQSIETCTHFFGERRYSRS